MKNLMILFLILVSTTIFSQEKKELTFKERLLVNFKKADSTFSKTKESKSFMKYYNHDLRVMQNHIDSLSKSKTVLVIKKRKGKRF